MQFVIYLRKQKTKIVSKVYRLIFYKLNKYYTNIKQNQTSLLKWGK